MQFMLIQRETVRFPNGLEVCMLDRIKRFNWPLSRQLPTMMINGTQFLFKNVYRCFYFINAKTFKLQNFG